MPADGRNGIIDKFFNDAEFNVYNIPSSRPKSRRKSRKKSLHEDLNPPTESPETQNGESKTQTPIPSLLYDLEENSEKSPDVTFTPWPKYHYNLLHKQQQKSLARASISPSFDQRAPMHFRNQSIIPPDPNVDHSDTLSRSRSGSDSSNAHVKRREHRRKSRSPSRVTFGSRSISPPNYIHLGKGKHKKRHSKSAKIARPAEDIINRFRHMHRPKSSPAKLQHAVHPHGPTRLHKTGGVAAEYEDPSAIFHLCMATESEAHYWSLKCETLKKSRATRYFYFLSDHRRNNCKCCRQELAEAMKSLCLSSGQRAQRNRAGSHAFQSGYEGIEAPLRPAITRLLEKERDSL